MGGFGSSRGGGGHSGGSFGSGHSGRSFGSSRGGGFGSSRSSGFGNSRGGSPFSGFGSSRPSNTFSGPNEPRYHQGPDFPGGPAFTPPPRPPRVYYNSGRIYRGSNPSGRGCGAFAAAVVLIAFVAILVIVLSIGSLFNTGSSSDITTSSVIRQPLPAGSVNETAYYTDELGLITNKTVMERGLKYFYNKTGIQPYVFLTDNIDGSHTPTESELDAFSNQLYSSLFTDEAHILVIFIWYNNDYNGYFNCGNQAKTVIDDEAQDILADYFARYIDNKDLTYEEFFSKSFSDAADRIMTVTTSPWIPVLIVLGVLFIIVVGFVWWRHAKKQRNLEAQQTEDMLKTPLGKFEDQPEFDDEAERRARNYDGNPDNDIKP